MCSHSRGRRFTCASESLEPRGLLAALVFDGTTGNDALEVFVAKEVITVRLNGTESFFLDDSFDAIDVRGLGGDDTITIFTSGDNDILARGDNADGTGTGNDAIVIGTGNLDAVGAPVVVTAGGGADVVRLRDENNNFSDPFTITDTTAHRFFFGGLTYGADLESLVVHNSRGSSGIIVNATSPATLVSIDSGFGADTINVNDTHASSPVTVLPAAGNPDTVNVNLDGAASAGVRFDESLRLVELFIGPGGTATIAPAGDRAVTVARLMISDGGRFDLTNNNAIIDYDGGSPVVQVQSLLASGHNGGAWNGSGIVSSTAASVSGTAVGLAEATDLFTTFPATFAGQSVDATSVLLRYTRYGDADLNRTVNLNDFNRLAANFGVTGRRWSQGDFDFNGTVNLDDFNRLAANFGLSV